MEKAIKHDNFTGIKKKEGEGVVVPIVGLG